MLDPSIPKRARPISRARSFAFPRSFRLKRRRLIRPLFDRTRTDVATKAAGCIRVLYRWAPVEDVGVRVPFQVGVSPGRRFATAVARNRTKRRLRTVVRHLRPQLEAACADAERSEVLTLMVLYRGAPEQAQRCIEPDLRQCLQAVFDDLSSNRF